MLCNVIAVYLSPQVEMEFQPHRLKWELNVASFDEKITERYSLGSTYSHESKHWFQY